MKILIAPMAAMAETSGPFSRASALGKELLRNGHEAAFCAARDVNYKEIPGIKNYEAPIPSLLGLPMPMARNMLKVARFTGAQQKKKINSFEQVLFIAGVLNRKHFKKDVQCIRHAIQDFKPEVVYAEFRIAAIVAAKLEGVKVVTGYSYPVQTSFASNPKLSKNIADLIHEYQLPKIKSSLEIFDWADMKIVPSSYDLEPIQGNNVIFTGPFQQLPGTIITEHAKQRNTIISYMGMGSISPQKVIRELSNAFYHTKYKVYIASEQVDSFTNDNIIVGKRFDFSKLMPDAIAYINHGGQNSIMTGLTYAVPQLICPGNVFERRYNAASVQSLNAGKVLETTEFNAENIQKALKELESNMAYRENAERAGDKLCKLGGVHRAVEVIEGML